MVVMNKSIDATAPQKTTLYLQPAVKKFLQYQAVEENTSMSEIVNDMVEDMLDSIWLAKHGDRVRKEPTYSFDEVLADMGLTREDLSHQL